MYDYHRSDLTDKLYLRYLKSYELTKETKEATGPLAYDFIQQVYTRNLRADLKIVDDDMKHYSLYKNKEFKHLLKLEKINFKPLSDKDYLTLSKRERRLYNRKESKMQAENKRFIKIERKFRKWIPLKTEEIVKQEDVKKIENIIEDINNVMSAQEQPIIDIKTELESEVIEDVKQDNVAQIEGSDSAVDSDIKESKAKACDTLLSAKEELKKNGGISLSEGTQMTLEAFFNTSNEESKT